MPPAALTPPRSCAGAEGGTDGRTENAKLYTSAKRWGKQVQRITTVVTGRVM